jgi:ribosome-associated protein
MSEQTKNPHTPSSEPEEAAAIDSGREASSDDAMDAGELGEADDESSDFADESEVFDDAELIEDFGPLDDVLLELVRLAVITVSEVKAENVVVVDVRGRTSYCDVLVLCTGITGRQVRAIANQLLGAHKRAGRGRPLGVEGLDSGKWALVDMGDVLVHVFDDPWRGYYDLDGLWMDAPRISMDEIGLTEEGLLPRPAEVVEE